LRLRGVVPPVVTPFTAEGAVDEAAFTSNLERLGAAGVAGVLVLGSNGEAASLDEGERLSLLRRARPAPASSRRGRRGRSPCRPPTSEPTRRSC
jgi:dihydrodipicolinate synthase/N-acetylneuraminate lyase